MPPPQDLIGPCYKGFYNVCTFRANFHLFLSNLGKTSMTTNEQTYIAHVRQAASPINFTRNIFLYEVSQLSDTDPERAAQVRLDLQAFLGLKEPFAPETMWYKPGIQHDNVTLDKVNSKKIDICQAQYTELRSVLMRIAYKASRWIRFYFIKSKDVYVSSPDYFSNEIMKSWERDPCQSRNAKNESII
jgi:hypothetical protein